MEAIKEKNQTHLKNDVQKNPAEKEKKPKQRREFDSPWKNVLHDYFQDFMALCWPELYDQIAWKKGVSMLDKELNKIARNTKIKNKVADKLVEVWLKNNEQIQILIHIEIQSKKELGFEERMFIYYYRIYDRHKKPIVSLAVLIDGNHQWRPSSFKQQLFGTSVEMKYATVKISDFLDKKSDLETSNNRFAAVILAQLAVLEKEPVDATLKTNLIKWLYRKGWKKDDVSNLLELIDWVIKLPEPLEEKCRKEIEIFEEEMNMAYVTSWERHGIEQGMQQGIQQGEGTMLLQQLQHKFKMVPDEYRRKIEQADAKTLLLWGNRILDNDNLEEIFKA